jgi:hypothetical protein
MYSTMMLRHRRALASNKFHYGYTRRLGKIIALPYANRYAIKPICNVTCELSLLALHDHLSLVSRWVEHMALFRLTQSLSLGAEPMPISSNVLGPFPEAEGAGVEGFDGGAGLPACAGDGLVGLGGCCCCCIVATLCGLGMPSWPDGRPADPGLPCPGPAVDGLEEFLLSCPGCTVEGRVCWRGSRGAT